jgi:hypothetical protein
MQINSIIIAFFMLAFFMGEHSERNSRTQLEGREHMSNAWTGSQIKFGLFLTPAK